MIIMKCLKNFLFTLLIISSASKAAVVLNSSRIIMAGVTEKTIKFDNTSDSPFIVQVEPDNIEKPDFFAIPPVFKIKEKGGQTVKIKLLSAALPQDKESLFYLNFTQIPGERKGESSNNRLNIIIHSRLKIIYRPESVNAFSEKEESSLSYHLQNGKLIVSNHSPNVLSIREISNGKHVLAKQLTLLPGENYSAVIKGGVFKGSLNAVMNNDYGLPVKFLIAEK